MKKNMGNIDRLVRVLVAVIIAVLYFTKQLSGTWAIILLIVAGIFILTSFISFLPALPSFRDFYT